MSTDIHHRRSLRLQGYDYAQAGAYFVTICTHNRECLFGEVVDEEMVLNDAGRMVQTIWDGLPERFPTVELDQSVVMPNHIHGILVLGGAQFIAPDTSRRDLSRPYTGATESGARNRTLTMAEQDQGVINHAPTLGEIIRAFKAVTARQIRITGFSEFGWQRNYYEHIIRDEGSLNRIREYIVINPVRWQLDRENPWRTSEDEFDLWLTTLKLYPDQKMKTL